MLSIQKMFVKYNYSKRSGKPRYIVIHDTANAGGTALNHFNYFNSGDKNASADFFVDSDNIIQIVDTDVNYSWQCGDGKGAYGVTNNNSLGIEMCLEKNGLPSEQTISNTLELTKHLMNEYNIAQDNVIRHYDASRKNCPATFSKNNWARWWNFKKKLGDTTVSDTIVTTPPSTNVNDYSKYANYVGSRCKELQEKLIILGYSCGGYGADGKFGQGTYDSLIQFQKDNGLKVDALAGTNTFAKLDELINKKNTTSNSFNFEQWVRDLQAECNRQGFSKQKVDGDPGEKTLNGCPTLRVGASGKITKLLQERLDSLGYNLGKYGADGKFHGDTRAAVIAYQKSKGLTADGIVGENTWRKLLNL